MGGGQGGKSSVQAFAPYRAAQRPQHARLCSEGEAATEKPSPCLRLLSFFIHADGVIKKIHINIIIMLGIFKSI